MRKMDAINSTDNQHEEKKVKSLMRRQAETIEKKYRKSEEENSEGVLMFLR